jgi:hypothetical protein
MKELAKKEHGENHMALPIDIEKRLVSSIINFENGALKTLYEVYGLKPQLGEKKEVYRLIQKVYGETLMFLNPEATKVM